jgi:hypothetical protein
VPPTTSTGIGRVGPAAKAAPKGEAGDSRQERVSDPGVTGEFNRITSYNRGRFGSVAARPLGNTAPISVIGLEARSPNALVNQVLESEPSLGLLEEALRA